MKFMVELIKFIVVYNVREMKKSIDKEKEKS